MATEPHSIEPSEAGARAAEAPSKTTTLKDAEEAAIVLRGLWSQYRSLFELVAPHVDLFAPAMPAPASAGEELKLRRAMLGVSGFPRNLIDAAERIVGDVARGQPLVEVSLVKFGQVRSRPLDHPVFPGSSGANAIWSSVKELARIVDGQRKTLRKAVAGVARAGDRTGGFETANERWSREGRKPTEAILKSHSDPDRSAELRATALSRYQQLESTTRQARPYWPDLVAALASRVRAVPTSSFLEVEDALLWEQARLGDETHSEHPTPSVQVTALEVRVDPQGGPPEEVRATPVVDAGHWKLDLEDDGSGIALVHPDGVRRERLRRGGRIGSKKKRYLNAVTNAGVILVRAADGKPSEVNDRNARSHAASAIRMASGERLSLAGHGPARSFSDRVEITDRLRIAVGLRANARSQQRPGTE